MAGFNDFLGAIRFGMGLVSGFTHQAQQERQANETQQLALLKILKDQQHNIVSIDPSEVQQSGGVLGALFGAGGGNTFNIGGRGFKVVRKAPMFGAEPTTPTLAPDTTAPVPTLNYELPQQGPSFAPAAPAAPTTPAVPKPILPTTLGAAPINAQTSAVPLPSLKPEVAAYKAYIDKVAPTYGLDPNFVKGLISHENPTWNPTLDNEQYGASGGQGLGQLVPSTATRYNVEDTHDPYKNLDGSMAYLKDLKDRYNGDTRRMAAAYQAGEDNIPTTGAMPARLTIQGRPVNVSRYVQKVHANAQREAQSGSVASSGTFAGPGATAPTTPGATPETQVAGRAAPGATAPMAPLPFSTPEQTLNQKLQAADADLIQRFRNAGVPGTVQERDRFLALQDRAHAKITTEHYAEVAKAQENVKNILARQEIHDPRILELADRVTNDSQVRDLKRYIDANPPVDFLPQATAALQATPLDQRPQKAVELAGELLRYNYKPERLREAFRPYMDEVTAARVVQQAVKQHQDISTADTQKAQQAFKDAQTVLGSNAPDRDEQAARIQSEAGIPESRWLPATQAYMTGKKAAATQQIAIQNKQEAFADARKALQTRKAPEGMTPEAYANDRLARVAPKNEWPEDLQAYLANYAEMRKELHGDNRFFVDPNTFDIHAVHNLQEADEKQLKPLPPESRKRLEDINQQLSLISKVEKPLTEIYSNEGLLKDVRDAGGWANAVKRGVGAVTMFSNQKTQAEQNIEGLKGLIRSLAVSVERGIFGERGITRAQFVERAESLLPHISPIPDTREQTYVKWGQFINLMEDLRHSLVPGSKLAPEAQDVINRLVEQEKNVKKLTVPPASGAAQAPAAQAPAAQAPAAQAPAARFDPKQLQYYNLGKPQ